MVFPRFSKEKLLPILVNRTVIFLFILCLFILFLYITGTAQSFIDSTQLFLLSLYGIAGIFLTFSSAFGMILALQRLIKTGKIRYFLRALPYLILAVFGTASVLIVKFILTLTAGNGAN